MSTPQLEAIQEAEAKVAHFTEGAERWAEAVRCAARGADVEAYYRWMVCARNLTAWWRTELHRRERGDVRAPNVGQVRKPARV